MQHGLVMSYIVRLLENVVTARHLYVGMYWHAVTQLLLPVSIVLEGDRSCKISACLYFTLGKSVQVHTEVEGERVDTLQCHSFTMPSRPPVTKRLLLPPDGGMMEQHWTSFL